MMIVTDGGGCDDDRDNSGGDDDGTIVTDNGSRNVVFLIPFSFAIFVTSHSRESFLFNLRDVLMLSGQ